MLAIVGDIEMGYDEVGSGLPLGLLHGFPHTRALWAPQLGALVDRGRTITLDLRGFGESTVRGPYTMDQYADDVAALLDVLGVERAVIGGLSMGGKSTRRRHPAIVEQVRRMLEAASVPGIVGALEAMIARPDSTPTLETIDVPTLVIVGDEDVLTPVAEAEAIHRRVAGSRLEVIAGAGHVSNIERPAAFNHVVSEFLARLTYE